MAEPSRGRMTCGDEFAQPTRGLLWRCFALMLAAFIAVGSVVTPLAVPAEAATASKETLDKLSSAQRQLEDVKRQLEEIGRQYESLAKEQAGTLESIESVQSEIEEVEGQIEAKYDELVEKQGALADRVSASYKAGISRNLLSLVLSSSSFEELTSNIYYANKVTEADVALIDEVREVKRELEQDRLELKDKESRLEELRDEQQDRLDQMQAKQRESEQAVANLSQEVKDLMDKRDKEIAEAIAAEARQREAQAKAAASSSGGYTPSGTPREGLSGKDASIVAAAKRTPSPGGGLCAMWVSQVYQSALGYYPGGNANDMYARCTSSNLDDLEPGMAVAVATHPHTTAGRIYGHIGIYIGNGTVMDNVGYVRTIGLDDWIDYYNDTVPVRWGWM